jgi:hypothetical protein
MVPGHKNLITIQLDQRISAKLHGSLLIFKADGEPLESISLAQLSDKKLYRLVYYGSKLSPYSARYLARLYIKSPNPFTAEAPFEVKAWDLVETFLTNQSSRIAREMGFSSVLLVGDPAYYHRFGFKTAADFGIQSTHEIPAENVMICELVPHALSNVCQQKRASVVFRELSLQVITTHKKGSSATSSLSAMLTKRNIDGVHGTIESF